jgi:hypothetical protein
LKAIRPIPSPAYGVSPCHGGSVECRRLYIPLLPSPSPLFHPSTSPTSPLSLVNSHRQSPSGGLSLKSLPLRSVGYPLSLSALLWFPRFDSLRLTSFFFLPWFLPAPRPGFTFTSATIVTNSSLSPSLSISHKHPSPHRPDKRQETPTEHLHLLSFNVPLIVSSRLSPSSSPSVPARVRAIASRRIHLHNPIPSRPLPSLPLLCLSSPLIPSSSPLLSSPLLSSQPRVLPPSWPRLDLRLTSYSPPRPSL